MPIEQGVKKKIKPLCLTRAGPYNPRTDKPVTLESQIKLKFGPVGFYKITSPNQTVIINCTVYGYVAHYDVCVIFAFVKLYIYYY